MPGDIHSISAVGQSRSVEGQALPGRQGRLATARPNLPGSGRSQWLNRGVSGPLDDRHASTFAEPETEILPHAAGDVAYSTVGRVPVLEPDPHHALALTCAGLSHG